MAYQDVNRAGKWTPPKSKSAGPKTTTSRAAWSKANAGRANASNSPPKAPAKSAAPAKVSTRMGGASSPAKTTQPTQTKVSAASVTGRKPSTMTATAPKAMAGSVKTTGASGATMAGFAGGAKDKGDNSNGLGGAFKDTGTGNLPSGVPRPTNPTPTKSPASASKKASTSQPKNAPPVPVSKPSGDGSALGGSSAGPKTPDYAVKAIQARSGPGRSPVTAGALGGRQSQGFTNTDATGGSGAKARPAGYSYMSREK